MPPNLDFNQMRRDAQQRAEKEANPSTGLSTLQKIRIGLKLKSTIETSMSNPSWITRIGGLLGGLGAIVSILPVAWQPLATAIVGVGSAIVGLTARNNKVTSEQAGAK